MNDLRPRSAGPVRPSEPRLRSAAELLDANRQYYDSLWAGARLVEPQRFNTWPLVQSLLPQGGRQLEIAPGLRPRLPLDRTHFVDISEPALAKLAARGASVAASHVTSLPFANESFDLVCALDIVEHVEDDDAALSEISRVTGEGRVLMLSVPLHPARWTSFDDFVGHRRRYEPERLGAKLAQHHLVVERSAVFGMQPRSTRVLDLGMWWLTHRRERALWWYNRAFMPLGLWFQKPLDFQPGMMPTDGVDEILLVCRKRRTAPL
ncbi:MAG: class I SAM-dependent methyltransferase [Pseudomonadota bacterium]|nr:class I SAM-dependent methyltransferase [Pseudomonadota bacterium]